MNLSEKVKNKFNLYFDKIINMNKKIYENPTESVFSLLDSREMFKRELEQEYIGLILLDANTALAHENKLLSVNEFSDYSHRLILDACNKLYNQKENVDIVTVSEYLEKNNLLAKVGGRRYINDLAINALENIGLVLKSKEEL